MKTIILPLRRSTNQRAYQPALLLIPLVLACFALSPQAQAVCQEGCLTNGNTALGDDALVNAGPGVSNTAVGAIALQFNADGYYNTGVGFGALQFNTTGGETPRSARGSYQQHHWSAKHGRGEGGA